MWVSHHLHTGTIVMNWWLWHKYLSMTSVTAVTIVATFRILFDQTVSLVLVWVWRGKEAEQVARVRKWTGPHLYRGEDENLFFFFCSFNKMESKGSRAGVQMHFGNFFWLFPSKENYNKCNAFQYPLSILSSFPVIFISSD